MKNYQFSQLLNAIETKKAVYATLCNGKTISDYFTKNAPKNAMLSKMVFRFSDTILTDKQKNDVENKSLIDLNDALTLKNGTMFIVFNEYFKTSILLINNTIAVMLPPSNLPNIEAKAVYNETLLSLMYHLAMPQSVTIDPQTIANELFKFSPTVPCAKAFLNNAKYYDNDVYTALCTINETFVPIKPEAVFFTFPEKTTTAKATTTATTTATATTAKTPVIEMAKSDAEKTPTVKKTALTMANKRDLVYSAEKARINALPRTKSNTALIKAFDLLTIDTVLAQLHQKSELSNASIIAFVNSEVTKLSA